ncbi:MAG TPA: hypothetical protein VE981_24055 [Planctomycetota bacterium]|nr:hypothetical protein [Planctomycetota bacterium]
MRNFGRFAILTVMSFLGGAAAFLFLQTSSRADAKAQEKQEEPKTVQSNRFELVDKKGKVKGVWTVNDDGAPVYVMFDGSGKPRLVMAVVASEVGMVINDKKGSPALAFAFAEDSEARVVALKDGEGNPRCVLAYTKDETGVVLNDDKEKTALSMVVQKAGPRSVSVADKEGTVRAKLHITKGEAALDVYDKEGKKLEK